MRDRAWRRAQNKRVVNKRLGILKNWGWKPQALINEPGRLRKWNFACSCFMCKLGKHTEYAKRRREDREYERVYSQVFRSNNFTV